MYNALLRFSRGCSFPIIYSHKQKLHNTDKFDVHVNRFLQKVVLCCHWGTCAEPAKFEMRPKGEKRWKLLK